MKLKNNPARVSNLLIFFILGPVLVALLLLTELSTAPAWIVRVLLFVSLVSSGVAAYSGRVLVHRDDLEI